eukprot:3935204-Rhodomonas_salina.2
MYVTFDIVMLLVLFVGQDSEEQPGSPTPAARSLNGPQCGSHRRPASAALSNETTVRLQTHLQTLITNLGGAGSVRFEALRTDGTMVFRLQHGASTRQEPCLAHGPNSRTMHKTDNQLINVTSDGWAYICCPHGGKCNGARFKLCRLQIHSAAVTTGLQSHQESGIPQGVVLSARVAAHLGAKHAVPLDSLCNEDKDRLYTVCSFPGCVCSCAWWGAHFDH